MLLRDLAAGRHDDWLQSMVFLIAPIYNADGNERFALNNRGPQYGPMGGQGQRPNAQGLDLNRDHMKLDSPEARAVAKLMTDYDPHVALDLHTTNGTRHAYHLTYSPPLHPGADPAIVDLLRKEWFPVGDQDGARRSTAGNTATTATSAAVAAGAARLGPAATRPRSGAGRRSTTGRASTTTTSACATGSRSSARPTPISRSRTASSRPTASSRRA